MNNTKNKIIRSDDEWKKLLTKKQFEVLRQKGTETPFTGNLLEMKDDGSYVCAGCGNQLFSSVTKFDSGCGWPSFWEVLGREAVKTYEDASLGMTRTEVMCARCGGHLGHMFEDGPSDKTGLRYCINSATLEFEKK